MEWEMSSLFSGFGMNTDIFDTNVINLAVVIGVVVTAGGDSLRDLLGNRKQIILDNIASIDTREKEIEDKMNQARQQFEKAKHKAKDIRQSGWDAAEKEKQACIKQAKGEAKRLNLSKQDAIYFERQKAINQVAQQIISLSVDQAYKKVKQRMTSDTFHVWVNTHKMTFYHTIQSYARRLV